MEKNNQKKNPDVIEEIIEKLKVIEEQALKASVFLNHPEKRKRRKSKESLDDLSYRLSTACSELQWVEGKKI